MLQYIHAKFVDGRQIPNFRVCSKGHVGFVDG